MKETYYLLQLTLMVMPIQIIQILIQMMMVILMLQKVGTPIIMVQQIQYLLVLIPIVMAQMIITMRLQVQIQLQMLLTVDRHLLPFQIQIEHLPQRLIGEKIRIMIMMEQLILMILMMIMMEYQIEMNVLGPCYLMQVLMNLLACLSEIIQE